MIEDCQLPGSKTAQGPGGFISECLFFFKFYFLVQVGDFFFNRYMLQFEVSVPILHDAFTTAVVVMSPAVETVRSYLGPVLVWVVCRRQSAV